MDDKKENSLKFNQIEYIKEYNKTHYKEYKIRIKPEEFEAIQNYCEKYNKSIQGLFLEAVKNYIGYMGK